MSAEVAEYDEKLRRKKEEEAVMWDEYMEQRKQARIKEEEDLKKLKERQAKRKAQRSEHEKIMLEMRRKQEEQRQRELEEKREKEEEAKRKRLEEAERKRQQMQEALKKQREAAKRSFALNKKTDGSPAGAVGVGVGPDLVNVASLGRSDIIKTKEQLAEEKKIAMQFRVKPLKIDNLGIDELKKKADELWEQIVQAESDRFDLEQRQARLDYELKTLEERAKQINRARAKRRGLDPEALTGKYPPKLQVASKYERRLDRRDFGDKKGLFEGGWDKLTKEEQEKMWAERINSFKETHGDKKVTKWDPSTLRQQREQDDQGRPIYDGDDDDDDDDQDMMDAYKNFINKEESAANEAAARRRSSAASAAQSTRRSSQQQQQQVQEESEEEEEDEEYEEEEIEEEEVSEEEE